MIWSGELWNYLAPSLVVLAIGLTLAAIIGVLVGLLLARFWVLDVALGVYITFLYSIPSVALVPLIVLWAGFETSAKVIILFHVRVLPDGHQHLSGRQERRFQTASRSPFVPLLGMAIVEEHRAARRAAVHRHRLKAGARPRPEYGMVLADLYTAISGIGYLIVRHRQHLPGSTNVRPDRGSGTSRRYTHGSSAVH